MATKYFGTALCAVAVIAVCTVWTLCVKYKQATTKEPDEPDFIQRDLFAVMGGIIVAVCAVLGV